MWWNRANLGKDAERISIFGFIYFVLSFVQQLILTYLREGDSQFLNFIASLIIFPVSLLDTVTYWWIFLSLTRAISILRLRKQEMKLEMYSRFLIVLAVSAVFSILIVIYQTTLVLTQEEDTMWSSWWTFQAFWQVLYFVLLTALAAIWRPTENNMRYAYVESDDFELVRVDRRSLCSRSALDTSSSGPFDLDALGRSFLDLEEESQEQINKMQ